MKLFEIVRTDTKTASRTASLDDLLSDLLKDTMQQQGLDLSTKQQSALKSEIKQKLASAEKTKKAVSSVKLNAKAISQMMNVMLSNLQDDISDADAARNAGTTTDHDKPTKVTPTTLPAIINKQLRADNKDLNPEWHMVKNLPGYLQSPIRKMGRMVFDPLTKTKIEDINVLASLGGGGPTDEAELNASVGFINKHGKSHPNAKMIFHELIPGYEADIKMIDYSGVTFLVVKDEHGKYVYSWPTSDSKHIGHTKELPAKETKKLSSTKENYVSRARILEQVEQLTPEQTKWLNGVVDGKWTYENGKVDVEGNVRIGTGSLIKIPVQFGYVSGDFYCRNNKVTTLVGAPREVGGGFYCGYNNLTSLAGAPREVGGGFYCGCNNLTSLAGAPREVGGNFYCSNNKFKSKPDTSHIKIDGEVMWK